VIKEKVLRVGRELNEARVVLEAATKEHERRDAARERLGETAELAHRNKQVLRRAVGREHAAGPRVEHGGALVGRAHGARRLVVRRERH